jgi:hypothetical protein
MEQREKRPLREQVRDSPELALENERVTLLECQRRLVDGEKRTKAMLSCLQDVLQELNEDIRDKKQALSIDDACLQATHHKWHSVSPTSQRSPAARASGSVGNEHYRQAAAASHEQLAARQEQDGQNLVHENQKLVHECQHIADQAVRRTEQCLQDRVNENQALRRKLEEHVRETTQQLVRVKETMSETKGQIKSLEEPMNLVSCRDSARKQRSLREQIYDPVSSTLEEHKLSLLRTNESLRSQRQEEKMSWAELSRHLERLKADLSDKTAALHIDSNCLHESNSCASRPFHARSLSTYSSRSSSQGTRPRRRSR